MSHRSRALLLLWVAAVATGCGDDASQAEAGETTPPPPATTAAPGTTTSTATDASSSSTGPAPSGCECASGEFCAAPHQTGVIDPDDEALVYACRAECVPAEDPALWCRTDVPSCCAGLACDDHGFCVDPNAVDTSSGSGSGSGSGSTTDGESSTTAGAESSSGSDSGASSSSSGA